MYVVIYDRITLVTGNVLKVITLFNYGTLQEPDSNLKIAPSFVRKLVLFKRDVPDFFSLFQFIFET